MGAVNWYSEPMKHCDNRRDLLFRGEVLGGNSRINGMIYTRGSVGDYDLWASEGYAGWAYKNVLPYFVKAETTMSRPKFQRCVKAMGFGFIDDTNSPDALCDGLAPLDSPVDSNRQRVSTLEAYLPLETALARAATLTICTGVAVCKIEFADDGVGHRARRVTFQNAKGRVARCLLREGEEGSCSKFGRPWITTNTDAQVWMCDMRRKLLRHISQDSDFSSFHSGIGPRQHLEDQGIEVVHDLPGVGSELCDHVAIPVAWEVPVTASLTYLATSPLKGALEFLKYIFRRRGILSMPIQVLSLFVRNSSIDDETAALVTATDDHDKFRLPDLEIMPLATSAMDDLEEHKRHFSKIGVFSLLSTLLRPESRGTVRLASSNPFDRPKVDLNLLNEPMDLKMARKAVRLALNLGNAMKT
ncbi:MAG: hypothetical protein Q9196_004283 [Gyalolechia fulgens]